MAQVLEQDERLDGLSRSADDLALVLDADIEAQSRPAGPDQVLRVVARRLAELCHAPMVDIYAVDGEDLRPLVSWQYGRFAERDGGQRPATLADRPLTHAVVVVGPAGGRLVHRRPTTAGGAPRRPPAPQRTARSSASPSSATDA